MSTPEPTVAHFLGQLPTSVVDKGSRTREDDLDTVLAEIDDPETVPFSELLELTRKLPGTSPLRTLAEEFARTGHLMSVTVN